jgi:hypothetical protein
VTTIPRVVTSQLPRWTFGELRCVRATAESVWACPYTLGLPFVAFATLPSHPLAFRDTCANTSSQRTTHGSACATSSLWLHSTRRMDGAATAMEAITAATELTLT